MDQSHHISRQTNETREASLSLWEALHDADLTQITSDPMERTVTLVVDIDHLREYAGLASGVTWRFVLHLVSVLLVRRWEAWPGQAPVLNGLSIEKQGALVAEYQTKGRKVSLTWSDFEQTISDNGLWISDATLCPRGSEVILEGYGHDNRTDVLYEFELVGGRLQCERTDLHQTSIGDLLELGKTYWNSFSDHTG